MQLLFRKERRMKKNENEWSISCGCHTYVTLYYNEKFVKCFDNDMHYMEDIIKAIETRTKMKFQDIPIKGSKEDFNGLRFLNGGFKKNWL